MFWRIAECADRGGKRHGQVRIAMIGMGAANVPTYRFLTACGADPARIVACDAGGILGTFRREYELIRRSASNGTCVVSTNPAGVRGGIEEALRGPMSVWPFSAGGGIIKPE
ncbi:MAG: hypothetical protein MRJ92_01675 [Nitrospira sp.]|nr:hypothetical protein [Nitrospira sp.]